MSLRINLVLPGKEGRRDPTFRQIEKGDQAIFVCISSQLPLVQNSLYSRVAYFGAPGYNVRYSRAKCEQRNQNLCSQELIVKGKNLAICKSSTTNSNINVILIMKKKKCLLSFTENMCQALCLLFFLHYHS